MFLPSDVDAICAGILCCGQGDPQRVRLVRIKNTLEIGELEVSESLLPAVREHPRLEVIGDPAPPALDAEGNLARPAASRHSTGGAGGAGGVSSGATGVSIGPVISRAPREKVK